MVIGLNSWVMMTASSDERSTTAPAPDRSRRRRPSIVATAANTPTTLAVLTAGGHRWPRPRAPQRRGARQRLQRQFRGGAIGPRAGEAEGRDGGEDRAGRGSANRGPLDDRRPTAA